MTCKTYDFWDFMALTWKAHIEKECNNFLKGICVLLREYKSPEVLIKTYHALFQSHLNYGIILRGCAPVSLIDRVFKL